MNWTHKHGPVVVIGASVAGLFTAKLLAESGVPVQVYERTQQLATCLLVRRRRLPTIRGDRGQLGYLHIDDAVTATLASLDHGSSGSVEPSTIHATAHPNQMKPIASSLFMRPCQSSARAT